MAIDVSEVIALKNSLVGDDGQRHTDYDTILDATHGNYYDRVMTSTWKKWQGVIYEPTADPSDKRQVHVTINLINPIIEAKRALWSVMPEIRVPYRSLADEDIGISDQLEKTIHHLWNFSRMGERLGDAGWYSSLLGTAIFCVYPDFVEHRPRIVARSPYGFYGVPGDIEQDGTTWKKVIFHTKMRGRQANAMWPGHDFPDANLVDVIEYWDEEEKFTIVEQGGIEVTPKVQNKLGFVPVVSVPNIAQPGQWWGKGDVIDAIPIVSELNKRFNIENHAFSDQAGAPWEAVSPDQPPEELALDPDAINIFNAGGGLKKSQTGGLPWQIYQSNQQLRQYIDSVTDFPEVMRSMFGGSNISGKAVNNIMGPLQARMELRQRYLYPRLQLLNKFALMTWEKYWGGETAIIRGSQKGKRYNLELKINDFEGYYENDVYLDSSAYFDVQSKVIIGLQMVAANGLSIKTFIQKLNPFTDDYTDEHEQIQKEQQERIQLALAAQMMAQSPMGTFPSMGDPQQDQRAMMAGNQNTPSTASPPPGVSRDTIGEAMGNLGVTPPAMIGPESEAGTMPGQAAALPAPSGGGELVVLADLIRSVPTVRGRVFLSGSILEGTIGPEGVEVWFTEMVDWASVRQHVYRERPDLKGQFNPQHGIPNVPALEVTPGTEGYEPAMPEEGTGLPGAEEPDLEALLGGASGGMEMPAETGGMMPGMM